MENNCLVTKLKGSVANDSLIKLGDVLFGVKSGSSVSIALKQGEQGTATLSGGATFSDETTQKTYSPSLDLISIIGDGNLIMENKYNAKSYKLLNGISGNIKDILYTELEFLQISNNPQLVGDISSIHFVGGEGNPTQMEINNTPLLVGDITNSINTISRNNSRIQLNASNISVNISNISTPRLRMFVTYSSPNVIGSVEDINLPNVTDLHLIDTGVTGNISNISYSKLQKLTDIRVSGTTCTGSIEGIADVFKTHREANTTLRVRCNGIITYNGSPVSDTKLITFDGQGGYNVSNV